MSRTSAPDTVVFIHGLWMTGRSWEQWQQRYEERGLRTIAPSWPGMEGSIEALREDPSAIEHLGIEEIVDHYEALIRDLETAPVIMGHSFGGVFTQMLLDRGVGAVGVAVDSGPVKGLLGLPFSTLRSGWPVLKNPGNRHNAVALTPEEFHYAFTNTLNEDESREVYDRYAVPGPGRVLYQAALANFNPHAANKVDFNNADRTPLLFIAGGMDHVAPASTNAENFKKYRKSEAITEYKEFPERSHYTLGQPGWEEVADFAIDWALASAAAYTGAPVTA
jgi:pimeloyl-ACP methyl ester carboxylesterase